MTEERLFHEALARVSPDERAAYLDRACAGDPALRASVEALLRAHVGATGFLDTPAASLADAAREPPVGERPGTVIGPYKLMEQIGEGGMGLVFVAEQERPVRRRVALKVVKPGMDTRQVVARFEAERQALALMDHPNIAKVFDGGATDAGRPYFVMELVKGTPVTTFCDENHLPVRERLGLFLDVCSAVQHAHQKGVIHRDLKPSNVLVTSHDGTPVVKVIDFGVAKATGRRLTELTVYTQLTQVVGTPLYMSPEQAGQSGLDVDTRTDIYSLGVLLYELLTGVTPFDGDRLWAAGLDEFRRIIREEEPAKPSTRLSTLGQAAETVSANRRSEPKALSRLVRGELDWIVMKCLEKDRNRRYDTASALAADVRRYLSDEPVLAGPPGRGYRVRKFVRRNRGPVLAGSLALALLVAGIVGTTIGLVRAEKARADEAVQRGIAEENERSANAAAAAERQATETARAREAETQAILNFVETKILAAARPQGEDGGLGPDVALRKALHAALPFVDNSFAGEPLIEARLRMTLGISFWHLGEARVAADQYQKARALYTRHLGPDHFDTLNCMHNLATAYHDLGRYADAAKLHEETLARRRATLGPDHPNTLKSMHNLASSYSSLGRHKDALQLREEVRTARTATLGPDHPDTLRSMHNLANSYYALGRYTEALKLHEETLARRRATLGPDHHGVLSSMSELARTYSALGRHTDALRLRQESLSRYKAMLGPDHPSTLLCMSNLAVSYSALGRYDEACRLGEETLALRKVKLGPDHPDTLRSMNNLANSYRDLGRKADALRLREEVLPLMKVKLGPDHPDTLRAMHNLAFSYSGLGRHQDALRLQEETLARRKAKLGADHPDTLRSMLNLASIYYDLARHGDALKLHDETLARRKAKLGPDHPDTLRSMQGVAASLAQLGRGAEAVAIIDECVRRAAGKDVNPSLIPDVIDLRLKHFAAANDAAGCRATAEMWEKLNRPDAESLFRSARCRAATAGATAQNPAAAEEEADRAMGWLQKAVEGGYRDVERLKADPDLAAVRGRDDFKKLLARVEGRK